MEIKHNNLDSLAIGMLVVFCASWGVQQIAVKMILQDISPVLQATIRSTGGCILVYLWMLLRGKPVFEKDKTLFWGIAAGLLFGGEFLLIYAGLEYTNASRAVVFLYLAPFVVAIGSQVLFPAERLNRLQFAGLTCSFSGLLVAFGESLSLPNERMLVGDVMLISAAVLWGATTLLIKASPLAVISPSKTLLYQLFVSAIMLGAGSIILNEPGIIKITSTTIASLLYQTVWIATITYTGWFWLIKQYPAGKLSSFSFLTPLFGVAGGVMFLDEPLSTSLFLAMCLVGLGIFLVNKKQKAA